MVVEEDSEGTNGVEWNVMERSKPDLRKIESD
jgi:hypothetical protein